MKEMFKNAADFIGDISNCNISNVENMEDMIAGVDEKNIPK